MTNVRNNWENLPSKNTPINAERLNNLEDNAGKGADFVDNVSAVGMDLVTAETALAARTFIGAGTSNLEIGTTATTAKAGNYAPTLAEIPSLPTSKINSGVFAIAQIPTGTTATTVALGNHTHANATTSTAGFMSNTDKTKLDGLSNYTLPLATVSTIGGIKKISGVEDTSGEDLQAIKTTLNELLANMREAGAMT